MIESKVAADQFVDMVSATAEVDLRLSDLSSTLSLQTQEAYRRNEPVRGHRNYPQYLDSSRSRDVLAIIGRSAAWNVSWNIHHAGGQTALDIMDRFHRAAARPVLLYRVVGLE